MNSVIKSYVERHFNDNPLECLYNEKCFVKFIEKTPFYDETNDKTLITQYLRILLIYILLNPREVLSKFVLYQVYEEVTEATLMFQSNMFILKEYFILNKDHYNILLYILKDMMFQRGIKEWGTRFLEFLENAIRDQVTNNIIL